MIDPSGVDRGDLPARAARPPGRGPRGRWLPGVLLAASCATPPVRPPTLAFDAGAVDAAEARRDAGVGSEDATAPDGPTAETGVAVGCGALAQPCCDGVACRGAELSCMAGTCLSSCGGLGQPCCVGGVCVAGVCLDGACAAPPSGCGGTDQPCCEGGSCLFGRTCTAGVCNGAARSCGDVGLPCCEDASVICGMGQICADGGCVVRPAECGRGAQACCPGEIACARRFVCMDGLCVAP